jgi:NodT family efflux transporter outer membrane factor (OMF) lipoprotein
MNTRTLLLWGQASSLLLLIGGAAFGASRHKTPAPHPTVPDKFEEIATGVVPGAAELTHWWTAFHDEELTRLIERAATYNNDLRAAAARVAEARALQGVAHAALLPSLSTTNSFERVRGGFSQGVVHVTPGGSGAPGSNSLITPFETNAFQSGFDASWELDFFGGNRKANQAAAADTAAADYARRDALVSVTAEVARNYIAMRGLDRRLAITRANIAAQRDTLGLTKARAEAGLGTQLEVEQQQTQLAATEAAEPMLEAARIQTVQRLGVLTGQAPGALVEELTNGADLPALPENIAAGFPSDLLSRRPDLRQAEAEVYAATARTGVARAELYPKFIIQGLAGRQATSLSGFSLGAGNFFSIGPGITLPIFSGGKIRANIAAQDARLNQAIARYEGAMLNALGDVEGGLAAYGREQQRRDRLQQAAKSSRTATELANELYTRGLSDFLSVLDAQRAQFAAEDDLAQSQTAVATNLVMLYKALGGGW